MVNSEKLSPKVHRKFRILRFRCRPYKRQVSTISFSFFVFVVVGVLFFLNKRGNGPGEENRLDHLLSKVFSCEFRLNSSPAHTNIFKNINYACK